VDRGRSLSSQHKTEIAGVNNQHMNQNETTPYDFHGINSRGAGNVYSYQHGICFNPCSYQQQFNYWNAQPTTQSYRAPFSFNAGEDPSSIFDCYLSHPGARNHSTGGGNCEMFPAINDTRLFFLFLFKT